MGEEGTENVGTFRSPYEVLNYELPSSHEKCFTNSIGVLKTHCDEATENCLFFHYFFWLLVFCYSNVRKDIRGHKKKSSTDKARKLSFKEKITDHVPHDDQMTYQHNIVKKATPPDHQNA